MVSFLHLKLAFFICNFWSSGYSPEPQRWLAPDENSCYLLDFSNIVKSLTSAHSLMVFFIHMHHKRHMHHAKHWVPFWRADWPSHLQTLAPCSGRLCIGVSGTCGEAAVPLRRYLQGRQRLRISQRGRFRTCAGRRRGDLFQKRSGLGAPMASGREGRTLVLFPFLYRFEF